jgi:hypothetical protein
MLKINEMLFCFQPYVKIKICMEPQFFLEMGPDYILGFKKSINIEIYLLFTFSNLIFQSKYF